MIYEVNSPLTMTGIIATIVSLIFACAAFYNSHRRRKHAENMKTVSKSPVPPPPEEVLRKHTQELVRKMTPPPATAPAPQQPLPSVGTETAADASSSPLFRKLGLHGLEESAQKVDETLYRWE